MSLDEVKSNRFKGIDGVQSLYIQITYNLQLDYFVSMHNIVVLFDVLITSSGALPTFIQCINREFIDCIEHVEGIELLTQYY